MIIKINESILKETIKSALKEIVEKREYGYWKNYDNCYQAARECSSRYNFGRKYSKACKNAYANGWIDEFFPLKK